MAYTRCVMGNPILSLITKSTIKTETKWTFVKKIKRIKRIIIIIIITFEK